MFYRIKEDVKVVFERDPAARSTLEVILCYPGVHAVIMYRIAHSFWRSGSYVLARFISHIGRGLTGIEIHPAAKIGKGLFIDHGMGVVIGETAIVGDNVTLYHQVTLGGTSLQRVKRHPTIEDNVIIGAGAKVLGNITIGENSRIGSGSVVVTDVPPNSTVVGVPGKVVRNAIDKHANIDLEWQKLPDPMAKAIQCLLERVTLTEEHLTEKANEIQKEFQALKCKHEEDMTKLVDINDHKEKRERKKHSRK